MEVTSARREDARAIAVIHVTSWRAAYASLLPADYLAAMSVEDRAESWAGILETSASRTLVARQDGEVLGFVCVGHCRDQDVAAGRGEVWALYVAPSAWSAGVGWALWEAGRVLMLHRGFGAVSLWVLAGNARGIRFYESIGFRRDIGPAQTFERAGVKLSEVRMVFDGMSASPSVERPARAMRGTPT